MEDLRFYDFEFKLLKIQNDAKSINWSIKYNSIGTFEAHFSVESSIVPVLMEKRYVVVCQGAKQAIITGLMITDDDFSVFGRTCNWILSKRTVKPFKKDDSGSEMLSGIIDFVFKLSFTENENYPVENMETDFKFDYEIGQFWRNTRNTAFDVIHDLCVRGGHAGHELLFDRNSKKWILRIYKGSERKRMISEADKTAGEITLNRDCLDFSTDGWYSREMNNLGEWNAETNTPRIDFKTADTENKYNYYNVAEPGVQNGITFETGDFVLCGSDGYFKKATEIKPVWEHIGTSEMDGIYRWEGILSANNPTAAADALAKKIINDDITVEIQKLKFGTDYNVGDVFRVQLKLGENILSYQKRITEVDINYENNIETIQPVLGEDEKEIVLEEEQDGVQS